MLLPGFQGQHLAFTVLCVPYSSPDSGCCTLVTDPGRCLRLKLSDARVYEPQIQAHLGTAGGIRCLQGCLSSCFGRRECTCGCPTTTLSNSSSQPSYQRTRWSLALPHTFSQSRPQQSRISVIVSWGGRVPAGQFLGRDRRACSTRLLPAERERERESERARERARE